MPKVRRKYGLGFSRYISTKRKISCPLDSITDDSHDWLLNPDEGQLIQRKGSTITGDTVGVQAGVLLQGDVWDPVARYTFGLNLEDTIGLSVACTLWGDEANTARQGQITFRDSSGSANREFGDDFSGTTYPVSGSTTSFRMVPLPYITKGSGSALYATGYTRCAFEQNRRYTFPGARRMVEGGNYLLSPNEQGTPFMWNKVHSPSTTQPLRARPWGAYPPLYAPNKKSASEVSSSGHDASWEDGDTFYVSVMFQYQDGSFSKPFVPRPKSATITEARGGLITVGSPGGGGFYSSYTLENITVGDDRVRARVILRTVKVNLTSDTDALDLDPLSLFVSAVIENNTQTTYVDTRSNDTFLRADPLAIRFDGMFPPRSRYAWNFDQRVAVGYTHVNPCAIILAPTGKSASRDLNLDDEAAGVYSTTAFLVRVTTSKLQIRKVVGVGGTPTTKELTISSTVTLQTIVDQINETLFGDDGGEWAAQLAPGTDGLITSDNLAPTTMTVSCTTTSGSPTVVGGSNIFAIGMKVSGTGVPAASIVGSKTNASFTLADTNGAAVNASASGTNTLTFWADTGDDGWVGDGTVGNMRAFCPAFPIVLALKASFIEGFTPNKLPDKRSIFFTGASPTSAGEAPSAFFNSLENRRKAPTSYGQLMGGCPLNHGANVYFYKGRMLLQNRNTAAPGDDSQYRLYPTNTKRGTLAWNSICHGDDVCFDITPEGGRISDASGERIITKDIFNPLTSRGDLVYEMGQAQTAADTDFDVDRFQACFFKHQIHLVYRSAATTHTATGLAAQTARPSSVTANTGWVSDASSGSSSTGSVIIAAIAEAVINDSTYMRHQRNGGVITIQFGDLIASSRALTITIRTKISVSDSNDQDRLLTDLYANAGVDNVFSGKVCGAKDGPAAGDYTPTSEIPDADWQTFTYSLSAPEIAAITTFAGLRLNVAYYTNFDNTTFVDVSNMFMTMAGTSDTAVVHPDRRHVYDFSGSNEASGLAQMLRKDGSAWGWSSPIRQFIMALGDVAGVLYGAVSYAAHTSPGWGALIHLETGSYDQLSAGFGLQVLCDFANSSTTITAETTGAFAQVAIGAVVKGQAGIPSNTTVVTKDSTDTIITVNNSTTVAATGAQITFYGQEVQPVGYFAMDLVGDITMKYSALNGTALYRAPGTQVMRVLHASDALRAVSNSYLLTASGTDEHNSQVVESSHDGRSLGEVVEYGVSARDGSKDGASFEPAEFWGLDAEIEVVPSLT